MKIVKLQPSEYVDNMTADGHEMTRLPYPFYVRADGHVEGDFWRHHADEVLGFQRDLAKDRLDLPWRDAFEDPQKAVGMHTVTRADGVISTHTTAIRDVEVLELPDGPQQFESKVVETYEEGEDHG